MRQGLVKISIKGDFTDGQGTECGGPVKAVRIRQGIVVVSLNRHVSPLQVASEISIVVVTEPRNCVCNHKIVLVLHKKPLI